MHFSLSDLDWRRSFLHSVIVLLCVVLNNSWSKLFDSIMLVNCLVLPPQLVVTPLIYLLIELYRCYILWLFLLSLYKLWCLYTAARSGGSDHSHWAFTWPMTAFLLLNLHELLLLLTHLKLYDPSTTSSLVSVTFLFKLESISRSVTYIFKYSLSLSMYLLLRLNLHSIAELCLFEHQTRRLLLLLLLL